MINGYRVTIKTFDGVVHNHDSNFTVPFGTEYQIGLYHNGSRRAVANIWIDGNEVTGGGLVVPRWQQVWLERPVQGSDKKFKFAAESSSAAVKAGKDDISASLKGRIKVEFRLEKEKPLVIKKPPHVYDSYSDSHKISKRSSGVSGQGCISMHDAPSHMDFYDCNKSLSCSTPPKETGVTVEGSVSNQGFAYVDMEIDPAIVAVFDFVLQGAHPIQTTNPPQNYCGECGRVLSPLSNFCPGCGRRVR